MRDGFIKVCAASPEIRVADCAFNAESAVRTMTRACGMGVKILALPELGLTGYTCGDLFFQKQLVRGAAKAIKTLCAASADMNMMTVCGAPLERWGKLYNCAVLIYRGEILGAVPKSYLPNYNEFYEKRQFTPAPAQNSFIRIESFEREIPFGARLLFTCRELESLKIAVEICEDLWAISPPSVSHAAAGAGIIINISASNEIIGKAAYRRDLVSGQSGRLVCGYIYADAGEDESTTDVVFAAHNIIAENGIVLAESPRFERGLTVSEIDVERLISDRKKLTTFPACDETGYTVIPFSMPLEETQLTREFSPTPFIPKAESELAENCEDILRIQSYGLKKRLAHSKAATGVVGISGGLDSALALLVAVRTADLQNRPRTDIVAVTMPCFGTTNRTRRNAERLCGELGVTLEKIDITKAVRRHFADIGHDESVHNVTYENCQARERTQVLMDIANKTGGLVIGTGDLSELALGWATYNGDHMSMYGVNCSIPKTLVRHLIDYEAGRIGGKTGETLADILATPVSPELLPPAKGEISQKTEDLVGPYELHDFFLYYAIRWAFPPQKVYRLALRAFKDIYGGDIILKWQRVFYGRFFSSQFKRSCLPDGPKVGSVSLSPRGDWRMPSDAAAALWTDELNKIKIERN